MTAISKATIAAAMSMIATSGSSGNNYAIDKSPLVLGDVYSERGLNWNGFTRGTVRKNRTKDKARVKMAKASRRKNRK